MKLSSLQPYLERGCGSVEEQLCCIQKVLGSIPSISSWKDKVEGVSKDLYLISWMAAANQCDLNRPIQYKAASCCRVCVCVYTVLKMYLPVLLCWCQAEDDFRDTAPILQNGRGPPHPVYMVFAGWLPVILIFLPASHIKMSFRMDSVLCDCNLAFCLCVVETLTLINPAQLVDPPG